MAIDTVLLCKDCVHSSISPFWKYGSYIFEFGPPKSHMYKCSKTLRPEHEIVDPVVGKEKVKAKMDYCETQRKHGECGPSGKHWTPKHKKDLFKMLTKEDNNAD